MDTTAQYLAQISRAPGTSAVGASAAATAGSQPASKKQKTKDEAARSTLKKYSAEIQTILKDSIIHLNDAFATASCYLDKAIGVNTSKSAVELVKEFRDCTVKARDPLVMLLNKKGKLKGFSRAAGKIFDPMDAATQTTDSATSSSTTDASTDMELTPAHWDSTEVREAKAAAKRRKTRRRATQPQQGETDMEVEVETEAEGYSAVVRRRPSRKPPSAARQLPGERTQRQAFSRKPPAILVKNADGKSYADTVQAVRNCGLSITDL